MSTGIQGSWAKDTNFGFISIWMTLRDITEHKITKTIRVAKRPALQALDIFGHWKLKK